MKYTVTLVHLLFVSWNALCQQIVGNVSNVPAGRVQSTSTPTSKKKPIFKINQRSLATVLSLMDKDDVDTREGRGFV